MTNEINHISLCAPEPDDLDMLFRLENDSSVRSVSLFDAPASRQMIWSYIKNYSADPWRYRQQRLVIKVNDDSVGTIDISDISPSNRHAMIGIALLQAFRGHGYGKKALDLAITYCRESLGLHQLYTMVARDNEPSLRLFASAGFKPSGCLRSWLRRGGSYVDVAIMQLLFRQ